MYVLCFIKKEITRRIDIFNGYREESKVQRNKASYMDRSRAAFG